MLNKRFNSVWKPFLLGLCVFFLNGCFNDSGVLEISILDEHGLPTAARVEITDDEGRSFVAEKTIEVPPSCNLGDLPAWIDKYRYSRSFDNPITGTEQFYVSQKGVKVMLPFGKYQVRIFKGIEYLTESFEIVIGGRDSKHRVQMERWIDMPSNGWFSADEHLHIRRLTEEDNSLISNMMAAEDIYVGNLLQYGNYKRFDGSEQLGFGDEGVFEKGGRLLISGQEHPRTHLFGHTIILGANRPVDEREHYLDHHASLQEAAKEGGAMGYAHWGTHNAKTGIALDAPSGLLNFIETLQLDYANYESMYQLLNIGIPITPTAGTDYPCLPTYPGRSRFYTKVEGALNRTSWISGIKAGRTFVSNGPILAFSINESEIGDTLSIKNSENPLLLKAHVKFDAIRDDVRELQVIHNGVIIATEKERLENNGIGEFQVTLEIDSTESSIGWYAVRATGEKLGETPNKPYNDWIENYLINSDKQAFSTGVMAEVLTLFKENRVRISEAHSAPIYVTKDQPSYLALDTAHVVAKEMLARLEKLRNKLSQESLEHLEVSGGWFPAADNVSKEHIHDNKDNLMRAIKRSELYYQKILSSHAGTVQ